MNNLLKKFLIVFVLILTLFGRQSQAEISELTDVEKLELIDIIERSMLQYESGNTSTMSSEEIENYVDDAIEDRLMLGDFYYGE